MKLFEEQTFEKINQLESAEYESCTFKNCNFSNLNFSNYVFRDCVFQSCELGLLVLENTVMNHITFKDSNLIGIKLHQCKDFLLAFRFENCSLKLASFYRMKIKKTAFKNCKMQEVDFTEADISEAVFDFCDLERAVFDNSNLEKSDFRTAYNYTINPLNNRMKKARFSRDGLEGLLVGFDIIVE